MKGRCRRLVRLSLPPERRAAFMEFFERRWAPALLADGALEAELWQSIDSPEELVEYAAYASTEELARIEARPDRHTEARHPEYEALLGEAMDVAIVEIYKVS